MRSIAILIGFFFLLQQAFSQGEYLYTGQSGFGASAGLITYNNENSFFGALGYSFKGNVDLGVAIKKTSMQNVLGASEMNEFGFAPYIQVHFVKQDQEILPFTLSAGASVLFGNMESVDPALINTAGDHRSYELSLAAYHLAAMGETFGIQPMVRGVYRPSTMKVSGEDANQFEVRQNHLELQIGFGFIFSTPRQQKLVFLPNLALTDQGKRFGMNLHLVLPDKKMRVSRRSCYQWKN